MNAYARRRAFYMAHAAYMARDHAAAADAAVRATARAHEEENHEG